MKTYLASLIASLVMAIGLIFLADPGSHWRADVYQVSSLWTGNQCLAMPSPEFLRFKSALLRIEAKPDIMVFGSSRALRIDSSMFPAGTRMYNASVSSASLDDYEAMWSLAKSEDKIPKEALVFLDNAQFSLPDRPSRLRSAADEFHRFISGELFLSALQHLWTNPMETLRLRPAARVVDLGHIPQGASCFRNDGSYIYPDGLAQSFDPSLLKAQLTTDFNVWFLAGALLTRDPAMAGGFANLVSDMESNGVRVFLVESPFQPMMLSRMMAQPETARALADVKAYADTIAQKSGARLCRTFDPRVPACGPQEFQEGIHPLNSCLRKLISYCMPSP
jgi:hypothetical protein